MECQQAFFHVFFVAHMSCPLKTPQVIAIFLRRMKPAAAGQTEIKDRPRVHGSDGFTILSKLGKISPI